MARRDVVGALARVGGRAALGIPFVLMGLDAFREPGGRVQTAANSGLPMTMDPEVAVRLNGLAMVAGGAALTVGVVPRLAAAGLLGAWSPRRTRGTRSGATRIPRRGRSSGCSS